MKRSTSIRSSIGLGLAVIALALVGCEGDEGPAGPAGLNPSSAPIITAVVAAPDSIGTGEHTTLFVSAYDPNGDPMTYAWTASGGTLSATDAAVVSWTAPRELDLYQVTVTVSDDDGSTSGSATIGVNVYVPSVFPSYLGDNANRCGHCHEAYVEGWMETHHAEAMTVLTGTPNENNLYCIQCHSTGFDDQYSFSGDLLQAGVDNGGYDENPIAGLAGVQCEACHGPMGPSFADHSPDVLSPLRGMACDRCHTQNEEYATSGHGSVIENAGGYDNWLNEHYLEIPSCLGCHTNEGFLIAWDEDWAGREMPHEPWQITCATCHDVHSPATDDNPAYLRGLAAVTTEYGGPDNPDGVTIDNWGNGQLCIQCHHARRDLDDITEQLELGDDYPGPHGSPQADMVLGYGCWEIEGYEYERESDHTPSLLPNMCVKCHLFSIPHVDPEGPIYGHTFAPDVRACQQCHEGAADFDIGGRRTEIQNLMTQLFNLLPNDGTELMPFDTLNWTYEQREAGYGYYFVQNEGSMGVHNYSYAKSILDNAIDYLTGDIVARRDNRIGG